MFKKITIVALCVSFFVSAQNGRQYGKNQSNNNIIYGKVEGVVKDKKTKSNLDFANITLLKSDSIINGTITNEKGSFMFSELEPSKYLLQISYAGYETQDIPFEITNKRLNKKLKNILLETSSSLLENIDLTDQAPVFENKIEKIVYNVGNDLSSTATDGIDVLRNAPLVSVDIEDNVSIRGSENIKFLLNGKSSSFLNSTNITDILQSIPADEIKSIEVITSPGAKYDAEGDAGIINIVTNKKNIDGFNAGINTNTGTRVNRSSFNLNAGKNRFGISASGGARYGWPRKGETSESNIVYDNLGEIISSQLKSGDFVGNWVGFRGAIDIYYDFNTYNSITTNFQTSGQNKFNDYMQDVVYNDMLSVNEFVVSDSSRNKDSEFEWTINYIKTFEDQPGRELMTSLQYGTHIHDDKKEINQENYDDINIENEMYGKGYEITGQVDYIHPLSNDNKLEVGLKHIGRYTTNDYETNISNVDLISWLPEDGLNNVFQYNQLVTAAYVSGNFNLTNDWGILSGLRYEMTNIFGDYKNAYDSFENSYSNIVPSVTISKKINMFKTIKLSYSNRLIRPDIHKINTNTEISDLNNISRGNPMLSPSNSHQFELGYSSFKPGLMTSFFLYYKAKYDVVEAYTTLIDNTNIFETNYLNTGDNHSFGLNFYGSTTIRNFLTLRGSFDLYTYNMNTSINNVNVFRESVNYKYSFNANLKLGKGYNLESRAFFRSPRQTVQGERPSFSMLSFGFKKNFNNKRGSVGIGIIEPFSKYKQFNTDITGNNDNGDSYVYARDYQILFRSFNISFKYKFGKVDFDPIKKKAKLINDDQMEDDGGDY